MKGDLVYLQHVAECIRRIQEDVAGGREKFLTSHTLQASVLRNLQTLSESTQRLSEDLKATHPEIERKRIAAFRSLLVHNYLGIDLETVWSITQDDLPKLKQVVATMATKLPHE